MAQAGPFVLRLRAVAASATMGDGLGRLAGVVLAGGRSRRMGTDKASLWLGGTTLLARVLQRVQLCCHPVLVVASPEAPRGDLGAPVVVDRWPGMGPLAGLEAGLRACPVPYAAVVACDLPFLQPALLRGLAQCAQGFQAAVPYLARPHPLCAVYHRDAAGVAEELLRSGGGPLQRLLDRLRVHYVPEETLRVWDPGLVSLFNVNTPADYAEALSRVQAAE